MRSIQNVSMQPKQLLNKKWNCLIRLGKRQFIVKKTYSLGDKNKIKSKNDRTLLLKDGRGSFSYLDFREYLVADVRLNLVNRLFITAGIEERLLNGFQIV